MPYPLLCHPSLSSPLKLGLTAGITRFTAGLQLHYRLTGPLETLRIPPFVARTGFADGLWQHTCFELFAGTPGNNAYREFNFSPSGNWAAYGFSDYRERCDWYPPATPQIHTESGSEKLEVFVELPQSLLPQTQRLRLGISAVIEGTSGTLSYWALSHTGERPDFHRRESFILELDLDTDNA